MSGMQTVVSAIRQARASLALTVARAKVLLSSEKVLAQLGARRERSPRKSKKVQVFAMRGDAPRLQRARTHQPCGRSRAVLFCCSETHTRPSCAVCLIKILIRQDITQYVRSGGIHAQASRSLQRAEGPGSLSKYYVETHVPLASKLPGLKASRYAFDAKPLGPGKAHFCIFEAEFESEAVLMAALQSKRARQSPATCRITRQAA